MGKSGEAPQSQAIYDESALRHYPLRTEYSTMLLGQYIVKLDEKGRLAVPVRFRNEIVTKLVVSRWFEECLVVVAWDSWQDLVRQLTGGELATLSARDTDRFLLGGSFEIKLDRQGRFVIPTALRSYAHIDTDVVVLGLNARIEIWDRKLWEQHEKSVVEWAEERVAWLYKVKEGK